MPILKRPFFLIEIFIAIALLTMCAFPLIHSSVTTFKNRKEKLFQLELARQAELLYYQFLKESVSTILFENIPYYNTSCTKKSPPKTPLPPLLVLGETFYPHYHLYHTHTKK
ncbi:MAG: hypothetical protein KDK71_06920, partial [Chlamydiia bacterium]|nr:hypothetical protein [Chlamydiia bacterium]